MTPVTWREATVSAFLGGALGVVVGYAVALLCVAVMP